MFLYMKSLYFLRLFDCNIARCNLRLLKKLKKFEKKIKKIRVVVSEIVNETVTSSFKKRNHRFYIFLKHCETKNGKISVFKSYDIFAFLVKVFI